MENISESQTALENTGLRIGELLQMQSRTDANAVSYSVRLIGFVKGRSVLVSTPMVDGKYLLMREGQLFLVRAFSGTKAFAFPTETVKVVNTPYPYLHLAYPKAVSSVVVRRGARAAVNVVCAIISGEDAEIQTAGTMVNVSAGGAQVATRQPPGQKGERLALKFKVNINGIETFLALDAIIRAINTDADGPAGAPYKLGLEFVGVTPEKSMPLLAYVYQELLKQTVGEWTLRER